MKHNAHTHTTHKDTGQTLYLLSKLLSSLFIKNLPAQCFFSVFTTEFKPSHIQDKLLQIQIHHVDVLICSRCEIPQRMLLRVVGDQRLLSICFQHNNTLTWNIKNTLKLTHTHVCMCHLNRGRPYCFYIQLIINTRHSPNVTHFSLDLILYFQTCPDKGCVRFSSFLVTNLSILYLWWHLICTYIVMHTTIQTFAVCKIFKNVLVFGVKMSRLHLFYQNTAVLNL